MTTIHLTTLIRAPIDLCFRLSLSIDLESDAVRSYGTKAIAGITSGTIQAGECVTWRTKQFGIWVTHTSEISGYKEPVYFQDSMVRGLFSSFFHDHYFEPLDRNKTVMRDVMRFSMPLYLGGILLERMLVKNRLKELLTKRNELIKAKAEAGGRF